MSVSRIILLVVLSSLLSMVHESTSSANRSVSAEFKINSKAVLKFDSDWPAKKNRIYFILIRLPQWYFRARISIKCWMHCTIGR